MPFANVLEGRTGGWETVFVTAAVVNFAVVLGGAVHPEAGTPQGLDDPCYSPRAMADLTIVFEQNPGASAQTVRERLDMFNIGATGISTYYPVNYFVKNCTRRDAGRL